MAATDKHATTEELLGAVFSVRPVAKTGEDTAN
jgi:hypothetical protein